MSAATAGGGALHCLTIHEYGIITILLEPSFEWGHAKDRLNRVKHGVSFAVAQTAFFDRRRVIAEDLEHSNAERRYFCFGRVGGGVMTVRFTYREGCILAERETTL